MNAGFTRVLAVVAAAALLGAGSLSGQDRAPRLDERSTPVPARQEVARAIAAIEMDARGHVLLVECNGAFGYESIQDAMDEADNGDIVVVLPRNAFGFECEGDAYVENINFLGKAITVQSVAPDDPCIVAATIIDCNGNWSDNHRGFIFDWPH